MSAQLVFGASEERPMQNIMRLTVLALGALGLLHGCAPSGGELEPGPKMKVRHGCLRTACQQRLYRESQQCSDCTSACFSAGYSCDPTSACEISCSSSTPCGDWEREECISEGWEVTLPNNPSSAIEDACLRSRSAIRACGLESATSPADCERVAAIVRPELLPIYECHTTASCDQWSANELGHCGVPTPWNFGDRFCAAITGLCGDGCSEEVRLSLNAESGWWRDDVVDAGMKCAQQDSCDSALDCYEAWMDALSGG
jgi:hypothetical protein